jgi:hypothetical protein
VIHEIGGKSVEDMIVEQHALEVLTLKNNIPD